MTSESRPKGDELTEDQTDATQERTRGSVRTPDDDRTIWNRMIDRRPALIAQWTGTADVGAAAQFVRETDVEDGQLVEEWAVDDAFDLLEQLGEPGETSPSAR